MSANATAGLGVLLSANLNDENNCDSMWSNQSRSTTPVNGQNLMVKAPKHRRAYSHSTIDEQQGAAQSNEFGAIKVVIERPSADGRPKTSGGSHTSFPTLEVPIPSYKLGTPRFSVRGTPFLRGSSYAPSDADFRSSIMSGSQGPSFISRRDSRSFHPATPQPQRQSLVTSPPVERDQVYELRLPPKPANGASSPKPSLSPGYPIVPEIFDALSTPPMCEDRSVIRRNPAGQISAATPARLIAEVTQELNYELVASFFITYRSYIPASDLLDLVMARLQHGINQGNKGLIVTVRCFTVMRHWLVNFFIDDFVLDYDLRVQFCRLVNEMVQRQALMRTNSKTTNDILSNIKKLWRDSCATYWEGPEFDVDLGELVPISPGGVAGSRDPNLTPEAFGDLLLLKTPKVEVEGLSRLSKAPILEVDVEHDSPASGTHGYFASIPLEHPAEFDKVRQQSIIMPLGARNRHPSYPERPMSPRSIHSIEAFSCSFPIRSGHTAAGSAVGPHPISAQAGASATSIARPPKPMRSNSKRGPRRNRSTSNSSRPDRPWSEETDPATGEAEVYFADRFAGSLIRGLVYLPPLTYLPAGEPWDSRPSSLPTKKTNSHKHDGHHSGGGMKKMFGTVRRAVSKSEGGDKPQHFPHLSIAFEQTAAIGCAAGAAVVQHCLRPPVKGMAMRPDKLGEFVEKDFEDVVEQHKAELAKTEVMAKTCLMDFGTPREEPILQHTETSSTIPLPGLISSKMVWADEQSQDKTGFPQDPPHEDAAQEKNAMMSGALPPLQITLFSETSLYLTINPTPPVTPPEQCHGRARHSSQLLGAASTTERTPSLAHGLGSPVSDDLASQRTVKSMRYPTMASFGRDSKNQLRRSTSLRRIASFQSCYGKHMRGNNFDATTFSDTRDRVSVNSVNSTHPPANRVLKRRPGGDLRAANTVKDLPQRSRSADSVATYSTYSASLRSSFKFGAPMPAPHLDAASTRASEEESRPFSVGALADPDGTSGRKPHISLFSTDSKPVMRASFQAEAAKLAQIPDDADDDGGVESALLKLEGKFEQCRSQITDPQFTENLTTSSEVADRMFEGTATETSASPESVPKQSDSSSYPIKQSSLAHLAESEAYMAEAATDPDVTPTEIPRGAHERTSELQSFSRNDYVYRNTPLLQRESGYSRYGKPPFGEGPQSSVLYGPSTVRDSSDQGSQSSLRPRNDNYDHESFNNIDYHSESRQRSAPQSFLRLEDDEKSSDRSRKVSSEVKFSDKFPPAKGSSSLARNVNTTPRPSKSNSRGEFTMEQALGLLPIQQAFPPTPDGTPTIPARNTLPLKSWHGGDMLEAAEKSYTRERVTSGGAQIIDEHMPFILSFPSALLAQQFTIIETEALSEIHFRELLEMKWSHDAATSSRSWPRFLQQLSKVEKDDSVSHGIEICAARSSIMTNWAISQVVLTTNLEERAKTITKLIHIANECRKLGNYATLFQITVALTNPTLAELSDTWSRVPAADIELLSSFESLIQPANNFRRLRDEMETVLGRGPCIPLIAVYAKDLKAMGDMPSYVANHGKNEDLSLRTPLINVGKCRAQATVVQLVARYLEGVEEMRIQPVQGVIERCLWVGGLREEEVRKAARGLV